MIVIGEKLNSSIPSVYAAIEKKDSRFVSDLAVKQEEAGAHFLDINAGMFVEAEEENLRSGRESFCSHGRSGKNLRSGDGSVMHG